MKRTLYLWVASGMTGYNLDVLVNHTPWGNVGKPTSQHTVNQGLNAAERQPSVFTSSALHPYRKPIILIHSPPRYTMCAPIAACLKPD